MYRALVLLALLAWPGSLFADPFSDAVGRYQIQSSSRIRFSVAQAGGAAIEGEFRRFSGAFHLERDIEKSRVDIVLEPASVTAGDPRVEAFIKSEPVFDVARHPSVSFRSSAVTRTGDDTAVIDGQLSAKGITRSTRFSAAFRGRSGKTVTFHVTGKLSRAMFRMDVGTPIYSNMVVLDMDLVGQRM